eukprot:CAMPEP_0198230662 /NCGR_PEP_ID=MMETSP1445-20131203/114786_1 /TAXON_ID=36898 /ORGANISM="Pyramimonas sp., Strain CCMP2087" /LENGTH=41 /DNA_ID= /DNA_START= /DNA_END= /DNA_ORIENTATION=
MVLEVDANGNGEIDFPVFMTIEAAIKPADASGNGEALHCLA